MVCANDSSSKNTRVLDILSDVLVTADAVSEVGVAADIMIQNNLDIYSLLKETI